MIKIIYDNNKYILIFNNKWIKNKIYDNKLIIKEYLLKDLIFIYKKYFNDILLYKYNNIKEDEWLEYLSYDLYLKVYKYL
jgi:hypothetical protein